MADYVSVIIRTSEFTQQIEESITVRLITVFHFNLHLFSITHLLTPNQETSMHLMHTQNSSNLKLRIAKERLTPKFSFLRNKWIVVSMGWIVIKKIDSLAHQTFFRIFILSFWNINELLLKMSCLSFNSDYSLVPKCFNWQPAIETNLRFSHLDYRNEWMTFFINYLQFISFLPVKANSVTF